MVVTYSPSNTVLTFGGHVVRGWDSISISRVLPSFRNIQGIRGKNTRNRVGNTATTLKLVIPQTNILNSVLREIVTIDEATGNGRVAIMLRDNTGIELFQTNNAYFERPANLDFKEDVSPREWTIHCMDAGASQSSGPRNALGAVTSFLNSVF